MCLSVRPLYECGLDRTRSEYDYRQHKANAHIVQHRCRSQIDGNSPWRPEGGDPKGERDIDECCMFEVLAVLVKCPLGCSKEGVRAQEKDAKCMYDIKNEADGLDIQLYDDNIYLLRRDGDGGEGMGNRQCEVWTGSRMQGSRRLRGLDIHNQSSESNLHVLNTMET